MPTGRLHPSRKRVYGVRMTTNAATALALRSSGAAGPHPDKRTKRERARKDARRAAIRRSTEDSR